MTELQTGLTWQQHQALGQELRHLQDRLQVLTGDLARAYGAGAAAREEARHAQDAVAQLRAELDRVVHRDCPEQPDAAVRACYQDASGPEPGAGSPAGRKPLWVAPLDEATRVTDEDKRWGGEGG